MPAGRSVSPHLFSSACSARQCRALRDPNRKYSGPTFPQVGVSLAEQSAVDWFRGRPLRPAFSFSTGPSPTRALENHRFRPRPTQRRRPPLSHLGARGRSRISVHRPGSHPRTRARAATSRRAPCVAAGRRRLSPPTRHPAVFRTRAAAPPPLPYPVGRPRPDQGGAAATPRAVFRLASDGQGLSGRDERHARQSP